MLNYTKGERQLYCHEEYWLVEIKGKPNRPNKIIGKFKTKDDALLDVASPDMYEALKEVHKVIGELLIEEGIDNPHLRKIHDLSFNVLNKAGGLC